MRDIDIVVNVRLASSRCPRKILRHFAGTNLLDITIDKLLTIRGAKNKYIAVGDEEILKHINIRQTPEISVLIRDQAAVAGGEHHHSVSFAHYKNTNSRYILILNPCLPFVSPATFDRAIRHFQNNEHIKTLTSVIKYKDIFMNDKNDVISLPNKHHVSTTTAIPFYKMAHAFHIVDRETFLANGKFWAYEANDPEMMEVNHYECFDIDTEDDFRFCEHLYNSGWRYK